MEKGSWSTSFVSYVIWPGHWLSFKFAWPSQTLDKRQFCLMVTDLSPTYISMRSHAVSEPCCLSVAEASKEELVEVSSRGWLDKCVRTWIWRTRVVIGKEQIHAQYTLAIIFSCSFYSRWCVKGWSTYPYIHPSVYLSIQSLIIYLAVAYYPSTRLPI